MSDLHVNPSFPARSRPPVYNCTYFKGRNDVLRFPRDSRYGVTSAVTTFAPSPRPSGSAPTKRTLNVTSSFPTSNSLLPLPDPARFCSFQGSLSRPRRGSDSLRSTTIPTKSCVFCSPHAYLREAEGERNSPPQQSPRQRRAAPIFRTGVRGSPDAGRGGGYTSAR